MAVSGASGFIGRALCRRLVADGFAVFALVRDLQTTVPPGCERRVVGDLASGPHDWTSALRGVETVFHLAAIADGPAGTVRRVNVDATEALARATFERRARFVYVSSIKVYGDARDDPVNEQAVVGPSDEYGRTKLDAELAIARVADELGGHWIALRPPIVYGPDERGNFARLIRLACSGWPLPLSRVHNRRSMIHVAVLVDALIRAASPDVPSNRAFVVAGGPALPTAGWMRLIANEARRPLRLWPMSPAWMLAGGTVFGVRGVVQRLVGSLEVDDSQWRRLANWQPPIAQDEAVASAVRANSRV